MIIWRGSADSQAFAQCDWEAVQGACMGFSGSQSTVAHIATGPQRK